MARAPDLEETQLAKNSGSGGPDRRPTRDERREEARRQRAEIQRKMARRARNRKIGLAGVAVAALGLAGVLVLTSLGNGSTPGVPSAATLLSQATSAVKTAGCSTVQTTQPYDPKKLDVQTVPNTTGTPVEMDHAHIGGAGGPVSLPSLSTYPTVPPASGPHNGTTLPAGVYKSPPPIDQAIHSLEHGAVIVWYDPSATGPALTHLTDFYRQSSSDVNIGQAKLIVAPYSYPDQGAAGTLPTDVQMALVAWHRLQTCTQVNLAAAFNFSARYEAPTYGGLKYLGEAREPQLGI
jgi:hypothetical protein